MKKIFVTGFVIATVFAAPAFAAPPKHHTAADQEATETYGWAASQPTLTHRSGDVVTFGDRVVGADPDLNIRTQLERDPTPSEY